MIKLTIILKGKCENLRVKIKLLRIKFKNPNNLESPWKITSLRPSKASRRGLRNVPIEINK